MTNECSTPVKKLTPEIGLENGQVVCPKCWSLCVVRSIEHLRSLTWVWWCGCGWKSEEHTSPRNAAEFIRRFDEWKKANGWTITRGGA